MADNKEYRFSKGKDYITFDSNGYVLEAKGLNSLMWHSNLDVDKHIIGKHVDELAEMLEKHGVSRNVYLEFEANVHVWLLKKMLQNASN